LLLLPLLAPAPHPYPLLLLVLPARCKPRGLPLDRCLRLGETRERMHWNRHVVR
jgi:hypothetical protein